MNPFKDPPAYARSLWELNDQCIDACIRSIFDVGMPSFPAVPNSFWRDVFLQLAMKVS